MITNQPAHGAAPCTTTFRTTGSRCTITGEIDLGNIEDFCANLTSALHTGEPVVVDLRAVTFFSISALRVLLRVHDLADILQCPMLVLGSPCVNRVLRMSGTDTEFVLPNQHS